MDTSYLTKIAYFLGFTHLWHISDDVPEVAEEVSIDYKVDPRKEEMEKNGLQAWQCKCLLRIDHMIVLISYFVSC